MPRASTAPGYGSTWSALTRTRPASGCWTGLSTERAKPKDQPAFPRTRSSTSAPRFPLSLPPVWNLPHHPNPNFTGREDLLAALEVVGAPGKPTVLSQAITGLGGVGKTQLAAEYAYRHRADYDVVWWVRAGEPATLVQDLAALALAPCRRPRSGA